MNILFFGSTSDSVTILEKLVSCSLSHISCIVTQPPRPIGRKSVPVPTPVETWGKAHEIPVLSFQTNPDKPWLYENEEAVINTLSTEKPDLLITACYGQKIPTKLVGLSTHGGLNIHPSLLPRWRGADPIPWTILSGDAQTGVTVVTISEKFDHGKIISQKKIPVTSTISADDLRRELFRIGADLLVTALPDYLDGSNKGKDQDVANATTARKLTRADGFIPWAMLTSAMERKEIATRDNLPSVFLSNAHCLMSNIHYPLPQSIERALRALSPWPGIWTIVSMRAGLDPASSTLITKQSDIDGSRIGSGMTEKKRLKILEAHTQGTILILDAVQLEGKNPVSWEQWKKANTPLPQ